MIWHGMTPGDLAWNDSHVSCARGRKEVDKSVMHFIFFLGLPVYCLVKDSRHTGSVFGAQYPKTLRLI